MARPRAADHDAKRRKILERSAELFAVHGYDRASLAMLARACGMSKALFYHYYSEKSAVLYGIISGHIEDLLAITDGLADAACEPDPSRRLLNLAKVVLDAYRSAGAKHQVRLNHLHLLERRQQNLIKNMERQLVDRFAGTIALLVPPAARDQALLKPLTMSLFAMLNWNCLWFRERGPMNRCDYAKLAVTLLIEGAEALTTAPGDSARQISLRAAPFERDRRSRRG